MISQKIHDFSSLVLHDLHQHPELGPLHHLLCLVYFVSHYFSHIQVN